RPFYSATGLGEADEGLCRTEQLAISHGNCAPPEADRCIAMVSAYAAMIHPHIGTNEAKHPAMLHTLPQQVTAAADAQTAYTHTGIPASVHRDGPPRPSYLQRTDEDGIEIRSAHVQLAVYHHAYTRTDEPARTALEHHGHARRQHQVMVDLILTAHKTKGVRVRAELHQPRIQGDGFRCGTEGGCSQARSCRRMEQAL